MSYVLANNKVPERFVSQAQRLAEMGQWRLAETPADGMPPAVVPAAEAAASQQPAFLAPRLLPKQPYFPEARASHCPRPHPIGPGLAAPVAMLCGTANPAHQAGLQAAAKMATTGQCISKARPCC